MDKTLLFKTKDAERPYDYWILICVNCASEVWAPWWRGATRHRADIPGQRECHDIPVWEFRTASAEIARLNAFMRCGFLPMHHRDAAVELRGELHTFVHVDHTPYGGRGRRSTSSPLASTPPSVKPSLRWS